MSNLGLLVGGLLKVAKEKKVEEEKRHPELDLVLADELVDVGEYKAALDIYSVLFPDEKAKDTDTLYHESIALAHLGHLDAAMEKLKLARDKSPNDRDILCNLGALSLLIEDPTKALSLCSIPVLDLELSDSDIYCNQGLAYEKLGRRTEALDSYQEAVTQDPDHAPALYNLGAMHEREKTCEQSLGCYSAVLRKYPHDPDAQAAIIRVSKKQEEELGPKGEFKAIAAPAKSAVSAMVAPLVVPIEIGMAPPAWSARRLSK